MPAVDIYDGDEEPIIYHGKTWTSKVSLRDVCLAIAKYAFVASPYPIIISAEVHCGLAQQDIMVDIMTKVFGDALIRAPVEGRPKIETLPSPEALKGKFLLKVGFIWSTPLILLNVVLRRRICMSQPSSTRFEPTKLPPLLPPQRRPTLKLILLPPPPPIPTQASWENSKKSNPNGRKPVATMLPAPNRLIPRSKCRSPSPPSSSIPLASNAVASTRRRNTPPSMYSRCRRTRRTSC